MRLSSVARFGLVLALSVSLSAAAHADVVGRLKIKVLNAESEKPLVGAKIILTDSAGVRTPLTVTTGADGTALTPPLENRVWKLSTSGGEFQKDTQSVTVVADATTEVEILLEPLKEKTIKITAERDRIRSGDASSAKSLSSEAVQKFPLTAGNRQSLTKAVRAVPGFAEDSVNQAHPRAEHSATSIYLNGFLLPGAFQGRAGQFLAPDALQTIDVITGGFAPEYGSETAAALNLTLRSGTLVPFRSLTVTGGGFGTGETSFTAGGQTGSEKKKLGYLINYTGRTTDNAIEAPQPDKQTRHNGQTSQTLFANFDYDLSSAEKLSLTVNSAPARTQIANRTGLGAKFEPVGQGFGYGGLKNASSGLASQDALGQDIYQQDNNGFGTLQYRKQLNAKTTAVVTYGSSESQQDLLNNTASNGATISSSSLAADSSIEFHPTIKRTYNQSQLQANLTLNEGKHTYKFGGIFSDQRGNESYQIVPGSQSALNTLHELDARLVAPGGSMVGDDYIVGTATATPTLRVKRKGYYGAAYAQDTFKATEKLTVNYGLRLDTFNSQQTVDGTAGASLTATDLSPRVNLAYSVAPKTIVRASYNQLFSQPPLAQGGLIGEAVKPQRVKMIETSLERQLPQNQTIKLAAYRKWFHDQLDTAILIPGTQIGVFSTVNISTGSFANGLELSYDKTPKNGVGLGSFFTWANAINKLVNGEEAYSDHDQLNTLSGGLNYGLKNGSNVALSAYYGSGAFSSPIINPQDADATVDGGKRQARAEFNFRYSTGSKLLPNGLQADLSVENLLDSRSVMNFNSPFTGTRFQQGRRVMLSLTSKF
ncbi:TonB-dependent receptor domain-containing protein [Armatimonas sp.]|uniref:TonB-dependent receptor plug domain-containing protein n=1 Tax=Armatimonas sp. TaxID=1872638 RepID=UPI003751B790